MSFTILPDATAGAPSTHEYSEAAPPDDDMKWREGGARPADAGVDPATRKAAQLSACEEKLDRAFRQQRPSQILAAVGAGGCTALKSAGRDCAKCRICPSEEAWDQVSGYYRAQKGQIFICAEKEPSAHQVEDTLTHELVHAFDHCRFGMRVPFVGWQAPWALECAATACSEVRANLLGSFQRHAAPGGGGSSSFGRGGFGGLGGLGGGLGGGGGAYGDGATFGNPSGFGDGGGGGDGSLDPYDAPPPTPYADPDALRDAVYANTLTNLSSPFGLNACRGRADSRAILDSVFNACIADAAPLVAAPNPSGKAFPPMAPVVAAAEKGGAGGGGAMMPPPPAVSNPVPDGGATSVPKSAWGEA